MKKRGGEIRNGECVLGLVEKDEYIVFQNYVVSILMKQRRFDFDFFIFFKKIKRNDVVSVLGNDVVLFYVCLVNRSLKGWFSSEQNFIPTTRPKLVGKRSMAVGRR